MKIYVFVDQYAVYDLNPDGFIDGRWNFNVFLSKDFRVNEGLRKLKKQLQKQCKFYQDIKAGHDYLTDQMMFRIGESHAQAHKDAKFVIISKQNTYDNIIKLLKKEGRDCTKLVSANFKNISNAIGFEKKEALIETLDPEVFSDEAWGIVKNIQTIRPVRRPKTAEKFQQYIRNFYKDMEWKEEMTALVIEELVNRKIIEVQNDRVKYFV
ncbi:hypothetical protein [Algivirga pacifica]